MLFFVRECQPGFAPLETFYILLEIYSLNMSTPGGLVGRSETALPAYGIFDYCAAA